MLNKISRYLSRATIIAMVLSTAQMVLPSQALASGQITARSLCLTLSPASATGVTYTFTFTPPTSGNVGAIGFEFCAEDPLQGTTCTKPTSMSTTSASLTSV